MHHLDGLTPPDAEAAHRCRASWSPRRAPARLPVQRLRPKLARNEPAVTGIATAVHLCGQPLRVLPGGRDPLSRRQPMALLSLRVYASVGDQPWGPFLGRPTEYRKPASRRLHNAADGLGQVGRTEKATVSAVGALYRGVEPMSEHDVATASLWHTDRDS
jgi:hypothetical protein